MPEPYPLPTSPTGLRVLIVGDPPLLVDCLSSLLAAHGFLVVGVVSDGRAAVSAARRLAPDLALLDIDLPGCGGVCTARLIKAQCPQVKILILTSAAVDAELFAAIQSGAGGYLLKSMHGADFIAALHALEQGAIPLSPGLAERLLAEFARLLAKENHPRAGNQAGRSLALGERGDAPLEDGGPQLTPRQLEVLDLVAGGLTYKQAGACLNLSAATVRYHTGKIMHLLGLKNRSQVIAYAIRRGAG